MRLTKSATEGRAREQRFVSRGADVPFADTSVLSVNWLRVVPKLVWSVLRTTPLSNTHGEDDGDDPTLMHGLRALNPVANPFAGCGRTYMTFRTPLVGRLHLQLPLLYRVTAPQPTPLTRHGGSLRAYSTPTPTPKPSLWSRLFSITAKDNQNASSFRKIVTLAKPEKRPLTFAVGLLLISSSVSMSIPFTVGKLIDYFTSANPVCFDHIRTLPG